MNTQHFTYTQGWNVKNELEIRKGWKVPVLKVLLLKNIGVLDSSSEKDRIITYTWSLTPNFTGIAVFRGRSEGRSVV